MKPKLPHRLTGRMLIARPELVDPHFFQSIVFIARHDKKGALGFILNRPSGRCLADYLHEPPHRDSFFCDIPVLRGGPVHADRLSIVLFEPTPARRGIRSRLNLSLRACARKTHDPSTWVRAFIGFAGWGAGQLEREIQEGSWMLRDADPVAFDLRLAEGLWPFLLSGDDRWRAFIDHLPPKSGLN